MNVVVKIYGRDAIPIRAIPFLTQWEVMSPDEIVNALSDNDETFPRSFKGLRAFSLANGQLHVISPMYWENIVSIQLQGVTDQIKASEVTHATGHINWREAAIKALPADAFVWRNEYQRRFKKAFGEDSFAGLFQNEKWMPEREVRARLTLQFSPFINGPYEEMISECIKFALSWPTTPRHTGTFDLIWSKVQPITSSVIPEKKEAQERPNSNQSQQPSEQLEIPAQTQMQRQASRWQQCVDTGLKMPTDTYSSFPRGVGKIAEKIGISRQALLQDLNAYRERLFRKQ